jgi:CHAT domain-containing protein
MAPALQFLGPGVRRLVVVPDGVLHQLPFDALRASAHDEPLATRYEMVSVPSASVWRTWRRGPAASRPGVLALADPSLATRARGEASSRNATLAAGLQLGPLPYARREARAIAGHLAAVDVIEGDAATERALKTRNLQPYGLIHFAAHAVADDARPERSAVLLAPGSADEDGLLQAREIEALDLEGRVVVLSACQTAAGIVQSGEGVLSLARAFFAAGARAVVGSRWPIRDDDAAAFFESFYRHLAMRLPTAAALQRAKIEAIRAGRPPAAWAGLVLLGSGDQSFAPAPASGVRWSVWVTLVAALLALAVAARRTIQRRFARVRGNRPGGTR